eukprot:864802-Prymnesium_polylepis.1
MVGTPSSFAGAEMITFFAPPLRCAAHLSAVRKAPVDSQTYSTPAAAHGMSSGERVHETEMKAPLTRSPADAQATPSISVPLATASQVPGNFPCTVSCVSK